MKKLLITRPLPDTVVEAAAQDFDVTLRADTSPMRPDELRMSLTDYDAVLPTLRDLYSAEVFADVANPRAGILANFGVGYNHIDVATARAAGVTVTNTPGAVTDATADIAMTLILMSCRRAGEGERLVRAGKWDGWHPTQLLGQLSAANVSALLAWGALVRPSPIAVTLALAWKSPLFRGPPGTSPSPPPPMTRCLKWLPM